MQHDNDPRSRYNAIRDSTPPPTAEPVGGKILATIAVWGTVGLIAAILGSLGLWALSAIWGAIL